MIIETDPSLLDVNIHPSKLDIKFSNFEELNNLIKDTINKALRDKMLIPSISVSNNVTPKYENLTIDIDRNNLVKEDNSVYKNKLEDLINFNNTDTSLELEELEDAIVLKNISNMPARVKCALLAWHTFENILEGKNNGKYPSSDSHLVDALE